MSEEKTQGLDKDKYIDYDSRFRKWTLTVWTKPNRQPWMTCLASGQETCPKTKKLHWQSCFYVTNGYTWAQANANLQLHGLKKGEYHLEPMKMSWVENIKYCKKEENGTFFIDGKEPCQGARTDLDEGVFQALCGGLSQVENNTTLLKYAKNLEKVLSIKRKPLHHERHVELFYGPRAVDAAYERYKENKPFIWQEDTKWDGYDREEYVIIEDIASFPEHEKRRLGQSRPIKLKIMHGHTWLEAKHIAACSRKMPDATETLEWEAETNTFKL